MNRLQRVRARMTYANVTASLALFIALGGVSVAATRLPRNSVASPQIVNGSVLESDLHSTVKPRVLEAYVDANGQTSLFVNRRAVAAGSQLNAARRSGPGAWVIRFRPRTGEVCVPSVASREVGVMTALGKEQISRQVLVLNQRADGTAVDADFYVSVMCAAGAR